MCHKKSYCGLGILISAILGIALGGVFAAGLIPSLTVAFIAGLVFAALALLYLVLYIIKSRNIDKCLCNNGPCVLIGSIGTIITGIIGLSVTLTIAFASVLLVSLFGFFFVLTLISIILLIICYLNNKCENDCCDNYYRD